MSFRDNPSYDGSLTSILAKVQAELRQAQRLQGRAGSSQALPYTIGKWVLSENGYGDLVATHSITGSLAYLAGPASVQRTQAFLITPVFVSGSVTFTLPYAYLTTITSCVVTAWSDIRWVYGANWSGPGAVTLMAFLATNPSTGASGPITLNVSVTGY